MDAPQMGEAGEQGLVGSWGRSSGSDNDQSRERASLSAGEAQGSEQQPGDGESDPDRPLHETDFESQNRRFEVGLGDEVRSGSGVEWVGHQSFGLVGLRILVPFACEDLSTDPEE